MVGGGGGGDASCALLVVSLASTCWLPLAPPNPQCDTRNVPDAAECPLGAEPLRLRNAVLVEGLSSLALTSASARPVLQMGKLRLTEAL